MHAYDIGLITTVTRPIALSELRVHSCCPFVDLKSGLISVSSRQTTPTHHLWKVRPRAQVEHPKVVKDRDPVVTTGDEDAGVVEQGNMISSTWWRKASGVLCLPLQSHCCKPFVFI